MKKVFLLLALLACASFAQVTATQSFDDNLYRINTRSSMSRMHMQPYLYFENTVSASTDARVIYGGPASNLQNNAIICEGDVSATSTVDGEWAHGGLYQYVLYWLDCDPPPSETRVRNNQPITWSGSYYDALFPQEVCNEGEPGCWGMEGSLVRQRVDTYERFEDVTYSNSAGDSNVVCKGTTTLRSDTTMLVTKVIGDTPSEGRVRLTRGMHTITNSMDVTGCLGVTRFVCDIAPELHEQVYGRTSAQFGAGAPPYTTTVGPATLNLRVVTNADLRCSAEFVSITPSPLVVAPGNSTSATVTIRNNCPASDPLCQPITVTGVSVSDGFRFTHSTSGMVPITYFTVNPGSVRSFPGTLTAPNEEGICTELTRGITFNVTYTCPGCGPAGDSISRSASYTVRFECPPGETTNLVPHFEPEMSRYDVTTGDDLNLTIITWNNGGHPSNPGETCIQIGHLEGGTTGPFVDDFPPTSYSYPVLNAGGQYGEPLDFRCTEDTENQTYRVVVNVDCPFLGTTNETDETDNDDWRFIYCRPPDTPPPGDDERYRCNIPEGTRTGIPGETYDFGLECTMLGSPVDCPNAAWSYHLAGNATVAEEGPDSNTAGYWLVLGTDARGEGSVGIEAKITFPDGNATCNSLINIPLIPCEEFV